MYNNVRADSRGFIIQCNCNNYENDNDEKVCMNAYF